MVKKISKICCNIILGFLTIMALILFFINSFNKSEKMIKIFDYSFFDVNGNSMYPVIKNGDLIVIDRNLKNSYEIGNIISFYMNVDSEKIIVTHEIVDITKDGFITKGINNTIDDYDVVSMSEIVGQYEGIRIPNVGYIVRFANTTIGYFLLVVLPLGTILFISSYELIKEIFAKKEEF